MAELTAQELRELPTKDRWSDDEALALYEMTPDGFEICCGAPLPLYVETRADRVRWSHCARLATQITGEPASGQLAGMTARSMYTDTATFTP
ncbi:MAG TPA: hypothetical protein VKG38_11070 [Solirubrobacteraceae bacterium]|nr:hypothetical protein [Solirubrobacteraceae bacterium]